MKGSGEGGEATPVESDDLITDTTGPTVDLFDVVTISAVVLALLVVIAGLAAALVGAMTPIVVGSLTLAGGAVIAVVVIRSGVISTVSWRISLPTFGALLVVGGFALLNMRYASEHLLTDRDPGVYVTTARWLADRGSLLVDGAIGAFSGVPGIDGLSQGYYAVRSDGLVYTQFQHGLAVILAIGHWIGGDWLLLKTVGVLSGGVVAAFFAFSRTVLRPWWALAATTGIAVNLVVLHFGRDAYSELLLMVFLYGGLWLLDRALRADRPVVSFLAGLALGGMAMVRIDAWMILAGLFLFLFIDVWSAADDWKHRIGTVTVPVVTGIVVTGAIGVVDLLVASPRYLQDLLPNVYRIGAVLAVVIGGGLLVSVLAKPWRWFGAAVGTRRRRIIGTGVAAFIILGSVFLYFIRPALFVERSFAAFDIIEYYQRLNGLPLDGSRRYWEMSLHWQAWYLGIGALVAGIVGWAWVSGEVITGRLRRIAPFFFMFSLVTIAFLWRPANTPDHLWMMRRFLSITIPGFVLFGFVGIEHLLPTVKERWGRAVAMAIATGLVLVLLIPPAIFAAPLARSTTQVGMYGVTSDVCEEMGSDAAVLVLSHQLRFWYEPALRAFCEIPAAGSANLPPLETLEEISNDWSASGRELFVASLPIEGCGVTPVFSEFIWYPSPERTLTHRPSVEVDSRFGIALYRASDLIAAGSEGWTGCIDPQR